MQSYMKLFAIIIVTSVLSVGFAQEASSSGGADTLSFPYMAEITGDNVYIRSGPGTNFYDCGKLNKGDKVKVIGKQFSWARIVPPPGSFSWISIQYVSIDSANPTVGTVTGDRVRVYAGSDHVEPLHSTYLQGKLDRGDKVKLLGEQKDDYYKIAPLSFAYLWVSTNYTKPLPAEPVKTPTPTVKPLIVKPAEVKPTPTKPTTVPKDVPKEVIPPPEPDTPETLLAKYRALQKQVEAERTKPIGKQNYTEIKKALMEIAENKTADKAALYAKAVLKQVKGLELALVVGKEVRLQDEQLKNIREQIAKTRTTKLAEFEKLENFAVVGKLKTFTTYGPGHYRIVDDSGKTICYALPSRTVSQVGLSKLIDKKVGLVGTIEPHRQTKSALIRFTKIMEVE
ncbi:MAG: SH3 domain-containing protein [Planctomycetota bacterium]